MLFTYFVKKQLLGFFNFFNYRLVNYDMKSFRNETVAYFNGIYKLSKQYKISKQFIEQIESMRNKVELICSEC